MKKWMISIGVICLIGALYMLPIVGFSERQEAIKPQASDKNACEIFIEVEGKKKNPFGNVYYRGSCCRNACFF